MFEKVAPVKYLEFARNLASKPEPEAQRTAADRAYYATFLHSRDTLAAKGYITPYDGLEDHRLVAETLKKRVFSLGNDQELLRKHRNKITYDTRKVEYPSLQFMIETADKIIKRVADLPQKSP